MNRPDAAGSPGTSRVYYAENHGALRWPFLAAGLYTPAIAIALFVVSLVLLKGAVHWVTLALFMVAVVTWAACGIWLPYLWPTGVRLDADGVRIGGVRWAEKHPGRVRSRTAVVPRQYSEVFSCPWTGVRSIGVTTDRQAIKVMIRHAYRGRKPTPLGNLAAPYMRAALVIRVERDDARLPDIRPASGVLWSNYSASGFHQPIWVVPTRRPGKLEAVLATLPLPSGTVGDPYSDVSPGTIVTDWSSS
jgi:hypothetical protein